MAITDPIERFAAELLNSLGNGSFIRLTLSSPVTPDESPVKILGRCVTLRGHPHLSLTLRYATRDVTKNLPLTECHLWLRANLPMKFRSALLCTTARDWQFISRKDGTVRLIDHRPSCKAVPGRDHDLPERSLLDESARDWLQGLGILDAHGRLKASMAGKRRQIHHYLEIFSHLAKECDWSVEPETKTVNPKDNPPHESPPDPARRHTLPHSVRGRGKGEGALQSPGMQGANFDSGKPLSNAPSFPQVLVDMGCGKGYLTFGVWHLMRRVWKQPVRVIGVEARPDLVAANRKLARRIEAAGLEFVQGDIQSAKLPKLDALVALHACDTATDDAIERGVASGAKLIVVAPCCHKQVRPQLGEPNELAAVLRHGLMQERMAEWVTDGLRALFLEWAGYRTKVLEFVSSEHTPKNTMIAAIRERKPFADPAFRHQIEALKDFFNIGHHALDKLITTDGLGGN